MRISVFGATGMAGNAIVGEALARGHAVTGISRKPDEAAAHERLTVVSLDVTSHDALDPVLTDSDAAVLTIRLPAGHEHLLAPTTTRFLDAAARTGTRVLVIGGAGPLRSPSRAGLLVVDDPAYVPSEWKAVAGASLAQLQACTQHHYRDWVYLSPPAVLERGPRSGTYRRGTTQLLTDATGDSRITADDLAIAVTDEIEAPGSDRHFTVAHEG
ncbi:NAD(P)-dependent oxidoreductase [Phytoactinopolyspora mesophila]|uniref:NAD(P)H-binding protein n=1 Tax=Phytoactinopolyspora mesophila TaxID=2650750 RepID=A0A7K3LZS0_9ACTN|nr:NAD(P)H-binding protein [Phytoactinopolyspora mesophila]NDL56533.1 NAD(P)H-binding protein [Phytoactinopolyspora mesophila]